MSSKHKVSPLKHKFRPRSIKLRPQTHSKYVRETSRHHEFTFKLLSKQKVSSTNKKFRPGNIKLCPRNIKFRPQTHSKHARETLRCVIIAHWFDFKRVTAVGEAEESLGAWS